MAEHTKQGGEKSLQKGTCGKLLYQCVTYTQTHHRHILNQT